MRNYRIYYQGTITINSHITLTQKDSHYLTNVLRLQNTDYINVFNKHGEWKAKIIDVNKNKTVILVKEQIKTQEIISKWIHLLYAPLKKTANSFLISKATELGVNELTQIITDRTTSKPLPETKLILKVKEASKQCERLSLPVVNNTLKLENLMKNLNHPIYWFNESRLGTNAIEIFSKHNKKIWILIGPEGGFSKNEQDILYNNKFIIPLYLNGNILRAETASIVALSLSIYL